MQVSWSVVLQVGATDGSQTESMLQTMMHAARASSLSPTSQLPVQSTLQSHQGDAVPAPGVALLVTVAEGHGGHPLLGWH